MLKFVESVNGAASSQASPRSDKFGRLTSYISCAWCLSFFRLAVSFFALFQCFAAKCWRNFRPLASVQKPKIKELEFKQIAMKQIEIKPKTDRIQEVENDLSKIVFLLLDLAYS